MENIVFITYLRMRKVEGGRKGGDERERKKESESTERLTYLLYTDLLIKCMRWSRLGQAKARIL